MLAGWEWTASDSCGSDKSEVLFYDDEVKQIHTDLLL